MWGLEFSHSYLRLQKSVSSSEENDSFGGWGLWYHILPKNMPPNLQELSSLEVAAYEIYLEVTSQSYATLFRIQSPSLGWEIPIDLGAKLGKDRIWGSRGVQEECYAKVSML